MMIFASDAASAKHAGIAGRYQLSQEPNRHGQAAAAFMRADDWT